MAERSKITGPGERDPEYIRRDIERTRRRMSRTIDEIQEKFTPEHVKSVAKSVLKEQTIDRVGRMTRDAGEGIMKVRTSVYGFVRDNPLPAAVVGLGLSWLMTEMLTPSGEGLHGEEHTGTRHAHRRHYPEGAGADASRRESRMAMEGRSMMSGRYGSFLGQNPLALMAVSIAAGAALAVNMPHSGAESDIEGAGRKLQQKAKRKWEQMKQGFRETTES
ncbi:MAG: DUF3618 domain-containing protein [Syntrophaceae bacterium]